MRFLFKKNQTEPLSIDELSGGTLARQIAEQLARGLAFDPIIFGSGNSSGVPGLAKLIAAKLADVWPTDAPLTLEDAARWVYESTAINRVGIAQMREYFANCGLSIDWIAPIADVARDPGRLREVATAVSLSPDDLMIKGYQCY